MNVLFAPLSFGLIQKKQQNQACTEIAPESARGGPKIHFSLALLALK
jgi:hypothetical protein